MNEAKWFYKRVKVVWGKIFHLIYRILDKLKDNESCFKRTFVPFKEHVRFCDDLIKWKKPEKMGENCRSIFVIRTNETFFVTFQHSVYSIVGIQRTKHREPYRPWKELKVQLCSRNWKMTEFQGQILHWISRQKIAFSTYSLLSLLPPSIPASRCQNQFLEFSIL